MSKQYMLHRKVHCYGILFIAVQSMGFTVPCHFRNKVNMRGETKLFQEVVNDRFTKIFYAQVVA